jgi:hypothetical protein
LEAAHPAQQALQLLKAGANLDRSKELSVLVDGRGHMGGAVWVDADDDHPASLAVAEDRGGAALDSPAVEQYARRY